MKSSTVSRRAMCLLAIVAALSAGSLSAQTLVLGINFDDESYTGTKTGSPAPTSVQATGNSGSIQASQDDSKYAAFRSNSTTYANLRSSSERIGSIGNSFDNTASTMGGAGGAVFQNRLSTPLQAGVTAFTVTGWFNASTTALGTGAFLMDNNSTGAFSLSFTADGLQLSVKNQTGSNVTASSAAGYSATGDWVFYAVTVDFSKSGNEVSFYQGSSSVSASLLSTHNIAGNTLATTGIGGAQYFGNNKDYNKAFDGYMDDISIYSGELSLAQLQAVQAIPEPSTYTVIAGIATLGLAAFRRKRKTS